jgi:hypothetical protein
VDFIGNWVALRNDQMLGPDKAPDSLDVNLYWLNDNYSGIPLQILKELKVALSSAGWYDKSDLMTDYFDTAYYMSLKVGRWDKPYKLI